MSVYDQRMKTPSNVYYFQLVPLLLVPLSDSPAPRALFFHLFKNQNLCDSSKNPIQIMQNGEQIKIPKAFINFNISVMDLDNTPSIYLVIESQQIEGESSYINQLNDADSSDENNNENNNENKIDQKMNIGLGNCYIEVKRVIQEFNRNGLRSFAQKLPINKDFQLVFNIYIEKTRFALQKHVRVTREKQLSKQNKNQDNNPFYTSENKISADDRRINVEETIISLKPAKNTPKNNDYVLKKSANLNKNHLTIEQQSAESRSRSVNKEENENKVKTNESEKQKQVQQDNMDQSQIEDDPLRDIEDFNHVNEQQIIQQVYYRNQTQQSEPLLFQMTKSYTERQTPKRQKILMEKKQMQRRKKEDYIKEKVAKQKIAVEAEVERKLVSKQKLKINWTSSHAIAIALSILMFLIMIKVMSPSRKV